MGLLNPRASRKGAHQMVLPVTRLCLPFHLGAAWCDREVGPKDP